MVFLKYLYNTHFVIAQFTLPLSPHEPILGKSNFCNVNSRRVSLSSVSKQEFTYTSVDISGYLLSLLRCKIIA